MRHAFTTTYSGRARVLLTKVVVAPPILEGETIEGKENKKEYLAIWDTGATGSAVTKKVVEDLGLQPTGMTDVHHADGVSSVNTYLVAIALPNKVVFSQLRVTEAKLTSGENQVADNQPNLLIGMDIIGAGDFALSLVDGKSILTYQIPSAGKIDFVPKANTENYIESRKNRGRQRR